MKQINQLNNQKKNIRNNYNYKILKEIFYFLKLTNYKKIKKLNKMREKLILQIKNYFDQKQM